MIHMDVETLARVGRQAFDRMHSLADGGDADATDFNERQFVFEVGYSLRDLCKAPPLWLAYEFHYPKAGNKFARTECDIVLWRKGGQHGRYHWLEIKSTGLKDGAWRNNLGALNMERRHDFGKLRAINWKHWGARHGRSWLWLYQTVNYRAALLAVAQELGSVGSWTKPVAAAEFVSSLGVPRPHHTTVRLPRVLLDVEHDAVRSLVQMRTNLSTRSGKEFSALIVACDL